MGSLRVSGCRWAAASAAAFTSAPARAAPGVLELDDALAAALPAELLLPAGPAPAAAVPAAAELARRGVAGALLWLLSKARALCPALRASLACLFALVTAPAAAAMAEASLALVRLAFALAAFLSLAVAAAIAACVFLSTSAAAAAALPEASVAGVSVAASARLEALAAPSSPPWPRPAGAWGKVGLACLGRFVAGLAVACRARSAAALRAIWAGVRTRGAFDGVAMPAVGDRGAAAGCARSCATATQWLWGCDAAPGFWLAIRCESCSKVRAAGEAGGGSVASARTRWPPPPRKQPTRVVLNVVVPDLLVAVPVLAPASVAAAGMAQARKPPAPAVA